MSIQRHVLLSANAKRNCTFNVLLRFHQFFFFIQFFATFNWPLSFLTHSLKNSFFLGLHEVLKKETKRDKIFQSLKSFFWLQMRTKKNWQVIVSRTLVWKWGYKKVPCKAKNRTVRWNCGYKKLRKKCEAELVANLKND
jgi:hypothetical protein